jgi:regulator of sirC expression with transglutaminase-like and TPR domain
MSKSAQLPEWGSLAQIPDSELPLFETALLIARDEYPELQAGEYLALVADYAGRLKKSLRHDLDLPSKLTAINNFLYRELGFSGNELEYADPRNSYLNQVFDRKLGIPISLAVVQIEVMHRIGLDLDGISFPGHYLVRLPVEDGILVLDPYNQGRPVGFEELRERIAPHMDGQMPTDQQLFQVLEPATARMTAMRMIRNLQAIYQQAGDYERVARSADRLLKLAPDLADALRDRGLAYAQLGYVQGVRDDLSRYLQLRPQADDADDIRNQLIRHSVRKSALN